MPKGYPSLTPEQKREIIVRIKEKGERVADLSQEYGVQPRIIYGDLSRSGQNSETLLELSKLKREKDALLKIVVSPEQNPNFFPTKSRCGMNRPATLPEYLEGRTPKEKHPFLFQKKFHPRQIRNARSVFSFGVAEALRGSGGTIHSRSKKVRANDIMTPPKLSGQ